MNEPISLAAIVERLADQLHEPDAPALGVHVLSESIYCPRAGTIAREQQKEDCGTELAPALGGLPTHDIDRIRKELELRSEELKRPIAWTLGIGLSILALVFVIGPTAFVLLIPMLIPLNWFYEVLREYAWLRQRLREAESAAVTEPNWNLRQIQTVQWWGLIRAGFQSVEKAEPIHDDTIRLAGKPWRVLQRGKHHYLVVRIRVEEDNLRIRSGQLRPQQFARIAAYAYLLNRVERAESDWAIVLFNDSDSGIAIPLNDTMWDAFVDGVTHARQLIHDEQADSYFRPAPPRSSAPCSRCPYGEPCKLDSPSRFAGTEVVPFPTMGENEHHYHSTCGDRFRWVPPHERAIELRMIR